LKAKLLSTREIAEFSGVTESHVINVLAGRKKSSYVEAIVIKMLEEEKTTVQFPSSSPVIQRDLP
jgi:hypothetical protein